MQWAFRDRWRRARADPPTSTEHATAWISAIVATLDVRSGSAGEGVRSERVVGCSSDWRMRSRLAVDALASAVARRGGGRASACGCTPPAEPEEEHHRQTASIEEDDPGHTGASGGGGAVHWVRFASVVGLAAPTKGLPRR